MRRWIATLETMALVALGCSSEQAGGVVTTDTGVASVGGAGGAAGAAGSGGSGASSGEPTVVSESGTFAHGATLVLRGQGFGDKPTAAPFRASYQHPDAAQRFQESGVFAGGWTVVGEAVVSLQEGLAGARVTGRDSHRYSVRMEYSAAGNWGSAGYSAGVQTDLPASRELYLAWWDRFEPGFDASHMETGAANFKWLYNSPGQSPHQAFQICAGGSDLQIGFAGGVGGATDAEQDANVDLPWGGGFYARPLSFRCNYAPSVGSWHFVELFTFVNSAPGVFDGWSEMRIDNQRVYRADSVDVLGDEAASAYFSFFRFGGNYGFDDSAEVFYRQYGDLYVDESFARVLLGDAATYADCSHLEVQIPTAWSGSEVRFVLNLGTFQTGERGYVYLFDPDQQQHGPVEIMLD